MHDNIVLYENYTDQTANAVTAEPPVPYRILRI